MRLRGTAQAGRGVVTPGHTEGIPLGLAGHRDTQASSQRESCPQSLGTRAESASTLRSFLIYSTAGRNRNRDLAPVGCAPAAGGAGPTQAVVSGRPPCPCAWNLGLGAKGKGCGADPGEPLGRGQAAVWRREGGHCPATDRPGRSLVGMKGGTEPGGRSISSSAREP